MGDALTSKAWRAQEVLDLGWPRKQSMDRFDWLEAPSNAAALAAVEGSSVWPGRRMAIVGPSKSGKTHLAAIWAAESGARSLDIEALTESNLRDALDQRALVVEDIDIVLKRVPDPGATERALFHLYNEMNAAQGWMLFTAREMPARWPVVLPDLVSRFSALPMVEIEKPDDMLMSRLFLKLFDDRSIDLDARVARFLGVRAPRNHAQIARMVEALDRRSVAARSAITIGMVKDEMGW